MKSIFLVLRAGFFLTLRYIKKTSAWTTSLVIFVMVLTFLNLVVVNGILVGLIEGSLQGWKESYSGEVIISTQTDKLYIENTQSILNILESHPDILAYSPRFKSTGVIEEDYQRRENKRNTIGKTVTAPLYGIYPELENEVTNLKDKLIEGEWLTDDDTNNVVLGSFLFERYFPRTEFFNSLGDVQVGDAILLEIEGVEEPQKFFVKGILRSKTDNIDFSIFIHADTLRKYLGRYDYNVGEIAISTSDDDIESVKEDLIVAGIGEDGLVQTYYDAIGRFLDDIKQTFSLLGTIIGIIGLIVASVTVFIVIFIMLVTRQRFIGILKAIGISGEIIITSYVMLSFFFATIGSIIGSTLVFGFIKPYFDANPLDFPFSDGILFISANEFIFSLVLLFVATVLAGLIPAKLIVRKNTLDLMFGR